MPRIYMVRHGKAAAGFGAHPDPGLDDTGRAQADAVTRLLRKELPEPISITSSPMARAVETAQPLAAAWEADIRIETRVAEIPSPSEDLAERAAWLGQAMQGTWLQLEPRFLQWRDELGECLLELSVDTVIFSHFVAINAAVGLAEEDPRMRIFSPDNCSVTIFNTNNGQLTVEQLGLTAETHIN